MGNCVDSEFKGIDAEKNKMEIGGREVKLIKEGKGVRVKMVLTKEELQWLMLQLKNRSESRATRIEDFLGELNKAKKRAVVNHAWKPSLRSITEISELL